MKNNLYLILALVFLSACGYENQNVPAEKGIESMNNQDHLIMSALFVQSAAEYKAQCHQAYNTASYRLIEKLEGYSGSKPAVVLDLDETVLDNSLYAGFQINNGLPYTPESWKSWTEKALATVVPGADDFLHLADSLNVTLLYVSNRRVNELEDTKKNMEALGLPQLADSNFYLREEESEKETRRTQIADEGYDVLLYCGDQLGDFDRFWDDAENEDRNARVHDQKHKFGTDYIIVPNPIYGIWERNLFKGKDLTKREKNQLRKEAVQGFTP